MAKGMCLNGTMVNTNNYSSPVPFVGLYIAGASMVCFLLILFDVWAGFRRKKYWFPCRFFSINSVTLTLISIAAKIPVDLTTDMPSKQDQLSKLCSTVFICLSMSFMLPSVATNAESESFANVTALSIFVITVVVNICIQMATGVIFSFILEHAIIMICMLWVLLRFWNLVTTINVAKTDNADKGPELMRDGDENMFKRLQLCYIYGYHFCLQLYACRTPLLADVYGVCVVCSTVLVQATLRSLVLKESKFCEGVSDYEWSMWLVVASQSLTIAVVTFAIVGRWLIILTHRIDFTNDYLFCGAYIFFQYLLSLKSVPKFVEKIFKFAIYLPLNSCHLVLVILSQIVLCFLTLPLRLCSILCGKSRSEKKWDEKCDAFQIQLVSRQVYSTNWILEKAVEDMERWTELNEQVSLKHFTCLLSNVPPSRESSYYVGSNGDGIKISLLSMVLLVEIAKLVLQPTTRDKVSLTSVLDEVFDIIHFIDDKLTTGSSRDRLPPKIAKVLHQYGLNTGRLGDFVLDLEEFKLRVKVISMVCTFPDSGYAYSIQEAISQASDLVNFKYRSDESSEVMHDRVEQIFVDMLHAFLAQLPVVVFAHILQSPAEEYQERVRLGLGFMCKLQPIKSHVRFSLPPVPNITSLFISQTPSTTTQAQGTQGQRVSTLSPDIARNAVEDVGEIQEDAQGPEERV